METALTVKRPDVFPVDQGASFIEALLNDGMITQDQLHIARIERLKSEKPLDTLLVELGFLSARLMVETKAKVAGYQKFNAQKTLIDGKLLKKFPRTEAETLKALPLYDDGYALHMAVCDPEDFRIFDRLKLFYKEAQNFVAYIA